MTEETTEQLRVGAVLKKWVTIVNSGRDLSVVFKVSRADDVGPPRPVLALSSDSLCCFYPPLTRETDREAIVQGALTLSVLLSNDFGWQMEFVPASGATAYGMPIMVLLANLPGLPDIGSVEPGLPEFRRNLATTGCGFLLSLSDRRHRARFGGIMDYGIREFGMRAIEVQDRRGPGELLLFTEGKMEPEIRWRLGPNLAGCDDTDVSVGAQPLGESPDTVETGTPGLQKRGPRLSAPEAASAETPPSRTPLRLGPRPGAAASEAAFAETSGSLKRGRSKSPYADTKP